MKQQREVILIRYYSIIIGFIFIFSACQGTHGKIQSYSAKCSVQDMIDIFHELDLKNEDVSFEDSTDNSGLNRPGYCDFVVKKDYQKVFFKIHFRYNQEYWDNHSNHCIFSIIEINGKINSQFGWFSNEKRQGLEVFESIILPKIKTRCDVKKIE